MLLWTLAAETVQGQLGSAAFFPSCSYRTLREKELESQKGACGKTPPSPSVCHKGTEKPEAIVSNQHAELGLVWNSTHVDREGSSS